MPYTFEEMFKHHFPSEDKKAKTLSQLIYNFERWTGRPTTRFQRWALEEQAEKLGIA